MIKKLSSVQNNDSMKGVKKVLNSRNGSKADMSQTEEIIFCMMEKANNYSGLPLGSGCKNNIVINLEDDNIAMLVSIKGMEFKIIAIIDSNIAKVVSVGKIVDPKTKNIVRIDCHYKDKMPEKCKQLGRIVVALNDLFIDAATDVHHTTHYRDNRLSQLQVLSHGAHARVHGTEKTEGVTNRLGDDEFVGHVLNNVLKVTEEEFNRMMKEVVKMHYEFPKHRYIGVRGASIRELSYEGIKQSDVAEIEVR
ncbi:hypothetical protein [Clostridium sp.]|uniref:hypothetical protein n=1 Tax=Clostridium sp. TaxID=1506 RepID=UPI003216D4F8